MSDPRYTPNHVINTETGFLENPAYASNFDSSKKLAFLSLYKQNGLRIRRTCDELGISVDTINRHIRTDPKFKEFFDVAEQEYIEELECVSRTNALNPRSVIERIFQLKCLKPEKYGQENKPTQMNVQINFDESVLKEIKGRMNAIDAQIISTESQPTQMVDNQGK